MAGQGREGETERCGGREEGKEERARDVLVLLHAYGDEDTLSALIVYKARAPGLM